MSQQLGVGELLPAIQRDAFRVRLGHPHEGALGHLAAGAHQPQPGPNSHRLRGVGRGCARRLVLDQHGVRGRQAPVLPLVDLNPVGVGEHQAHVGVLARRPRELAAGQPHRLGQRHLLGFPNPKPADELEDALVRAAVLRELVAVAAREVPQQVAVLQRPLNAGPGEAVQHRRQLPEIAHEQEPHAAIQRHASHIGPKACVHLGDLLDHQPIELAAAVAHRAAHPVVGGLRSQPQVLRRAVGFRDQLHHVAGLPQLLHDAPREVRLPAAGQCGEQQAAPLQAVGHRVLDSLPAAGLRRPGLDLGLEVVAPQLLDLLAPVDRRAVRVAQAREPLHRRPILLGQILQAQAVGLQELEVAHRHLRQHLADPGHGAVLRRHHEIPSGPVRGVAEELRHEDVIPVRLAGRVHKGLAVLAPVAIELVVGGAHQVDQVHVARPQPDQRIDAQLGQVLLGPGLLHLAQRPGKAARVHVGGGIQAPQEVLPRRDAGLQHDVGARRLGVPAFAHVWQPGKQRHAAVLPEPDVGQVGQVALPRFLHRVQWTEHRQRFLRQRTTSTPQQTRSSFHFCSPQTSGGSRGEFT